MCKAVTSQAILVEWTDGIIYNATVDEIIAATRARIEYGPGEVETVDLGSMIRIGTIQCVDQELNEWVGYLLYCKAVEEDDAPAAPSSGGGGGDTDGDKESEEQCTEHGSIATMSNGELLKYCSSQKQTMLCGECDADVEAAAQARARAAELGGHVILESTLQRMEVNLDKEEVAGALSGYHNE